MLKHCVLFSFFLVIALPLFAAEPATPIHRTVLPNGLTLVTIEEHGQPLVSINVWYHVGAKDETQGQAGLAHLFEHMMFEGSEHHTGNFVKAIEGVGGTAVNGLTNQDRTAYVEVVPVASLDYALWLEADRMRSPLGTVDQKTLDGQRAVVENEKRQEEDASYSVAGRLIAENTYPPGHPYHHSTIGEVPDLRLASLSDVHQWFRTYYGAANTVLVLAGDITPEAARTKVEKYFGDLPSGPPLAHQTSWIAKMRGTHRQTVEDRVPRARLYKVWNIPGFGSADGVFLDLVSDCLALGSTSRLYKALVDTQTADEVRAYVQLHEMGGQFRIEATAHPGHSLDDIEKIVDRELARFLRDGPTAEELERVRAQYTADYYRNLDDMAGPGSWPARVAETELFGHGADPSPLTLDRVSAATADDLKGAARAWLSDGVYVLNLVPFKFTTASTTSQVSPAPPAGPVSGFKPQFQTTTLSNGMKVVLAERHETPMVNVSVAFDGGSDADPCDLAGTASLGLAVIGAGGETKSGAQIATQLEQLGTTLRADTTANLSILRLSILRKNLLPSLQILSDMLLHPTFPEQQIATQKSLMLANIQKEEKIPMYTALHVLGGILYKPACATNPFAADGTSDSVQRIARKDLVRFWESRFRPNNATIIVAGDITLAQIRAGLETVFAGWTPARVPAKNSLKVDAGPKSSIYLVDKPGARQSFVLAAVPGISIRDARQPAAEAMNDALGGNHSSRLNLDLREEKHWTYGVRSRFIDARESRPLVLYASVQGERTADAIKEMKKQFTALWSTQPVSREELQEVKANQISRLEVSQQTLDGTADLLLQPLELGLSEHYYESLPEKIASLRPEDIKDAAEALLQPERIVWVVVGDRQKLESSIREAGIGEVRVMPLKPAQAVRLFQLPEVSAHSR